MTFYQPRREPPTRRVPGPEPGRHGTLLPPPEWGSRPGIASRMEYSAPQREGSSGQATPIRGSIKGNGYSIGLPKPPGRGVSPTIEAKPNVNHPSPHGRRDLVPSPPAEVPQLKEKGSRHILRRKGSSIYDDTKLIEAVDAHNTSNATSEWPIKTSTPLKEFEIPISCQADEKAEEYLATAAHPPAADISWPVIPELDRYRSTPGHAQINPTRLATERPHRLATHDLPPPTPMSSGLSSQSYYSGFSGQSGYSASPSTRYSESPGPGAHSRDTTPTSMSSQSPGVIAHMRMNTRLRQPSPINARPPVTCRRIGSPPDEKDSQTLETQGLPSLQESLTSSSSNSTVKNTDKLARKTKERKKMKRLSPLPPSPPPRKSSQKFKVPPLSANSLPSKNIKLAARSANNVVSPVKQHAITSPSSNSTTGPPKRPSRDNTPDLHSQFEEPITIIQSNLPATHFAANKRLSYSALPRPSVTNAPRAEASRPDLQSREPTQIYSTSPVKGIQREQTPAPLGLGIVTDARTVARIDQSRRGPALRTPSPGVTKPKTQFGLFGRRTKTTPELAADQKAKSTRKGPAAGTGHEGYGKYGPHARRFSTGAGRGSSSPSQDSLTNSPGPGQFLQGRMSPIINTGGGGVSDYGGSSLELTRSESSQSLPIRPSIDSNDGGSLKSVLSNGQSRGSALPRNQALNRSSVSLGSKATAGSGSSDNDFFASNPSLAIRRSMNRLNTSDIDALRLPKSFNIYHDGQSMSSLETSLMSKDTRQEGTRSAPLEKRGPRKLLKHPRSPRKWNFFQKSQPTTNLQPLNTVVSATISAALEKPVAYYAMMDSSGQEEEENMDIEDILREAEVVDLSRFDSDSQGSGKNMTIQEQNAELISHPDPPLLSRHEPQGSSPVLDSSSLQAATPLLSPTADQSSIRPSRLPQVGRIPRVITARPEQTSPKSFSRPFARFSMSQPQPSLNAVDRHSIALGPSPERSPTRTDKSSPAVSKASVQNSSSAQTKDFFETSSRKSSAATNSCSSGGMSLVGITAVIPDPDSALEEDEVWDEYDDLIANEETVKIPHSATSSHGNPFQYDDMETKEARLEPAKESPTVDTISIVKRTGIDKLRLALAPSIIYSPDVSARFKETFHPASPSTPMSFSDFISGYGDRNNSVIVSSSGSRRASSVHNSRESRPTSSHSKSASVGETSRSSGSSRLMTIAEQTQESPTAQVNLRVGSMTVSKWLTFGHVLFSPIRNEFSQTEAGSKHHSVLVIDGLGNDDWSFYAAETYPSVTFYNLSSTPSRNNSPAHNSSISLPQLPSNHHQIQYTSYLDKLPFPCDNFSAVVLRFLPACSDAALRNLIAESKRVLKPSGYLELSILDLDMMNMGNRARRALRGLKIQLSIASPDVSLASASDTVTRLIGRRGFHDIKSCRVGVPVASTVPSAPEKVLNHSSSPPATRDNPSPERSLTEMMRDKSSAGDADITKMVAKVGRWWYMRCYEMGVLPAGEAGRSIFADEALLKECEKWSTSFKLLVCHAQKPVVPRRRTASV